MITTKIEHRKAVYVTGAIEEMTSIIQDYIHEGWFVETVIPHRQGGVILVLRR